MKTWMAVALVVLGILATILFCYWLSNTLSLEWCIGISIALNFVVSCYLAYQKHCEN